MHTDLGFLSPSSLVQHLQRSITFLFEQVRPQRDKHRTFCQQVNTVRVQQVDEKLKATNGQKSSNFLDIGGPVGPGVCDHSAADRAANLLTTIPYLILGHRACRQARTPRSKQYGWSLYGVAAGSTLFHAASGHWKPWARKLDYWLIALSSTALLRVIKLDTPAAASGAAVLAIPLQPFIVSTANSLAVETEFWRRKQELPRDHAICKAHSTHANAAALAMGCFLLEEMQPHLPFVHASWHCLSAIGMASMQPLVDDADHRYLGADSKR